MHKMQVSTLDLERLGKRKEEESYGYPVGSELIKVPKFRRLYNISTSQY